MIASNNGFHLYGVLIGLAFVFEYYWVLNKADEYGLAKDKVRKILIVSTVCALVGARLYHVLDLLPYYLEQPVEIAYLWHGGLGIFGALAGGLLGVATACRIWQIHTVTVLNLILPPMLLAQAIGRIGNLVNSEFVTAASVEFVLLGIAFGIFIWRYSQLKNKGFGYYLLAYGVIRLITEQLRDDTWQIAGVKVATVLSVAFIVTGLYLLTNTSFAVPVIAIPIKSGVAIFFRLLRLLRPCSGSSQ